MRYSIERASSKGQAKAARNLFTVFGAIFAFVLVALGLIIAVYGNVDNFFQAIIHWSLENRYERIVAGYSLWPWAIWIFLLSFVAVLVFVLLVVLYLTLMERKVLGWFQIRLGPNRVGPWGLLQPFADMIKLLIKEDIVPRNADKWLHLIAPGFIFVPTLLAFVAIPFARGTVELPQQIVAPSFDTMWVERIDEAAAAERGLPGPGWLEAGVAIEENEEVHKVWWVDVELDHEPRFIPVDEKGTSITVDDRGNQEFNRYRASHIFRLQVKPENPSDPPKYADHFRLVDYKTLGRTYDVLEIHPTGSSSHDQIIELGLNGSIIDDVEAQFAQMLSSVGPDVPLEDRFNFENRSPQVYLKELFNKFADGVAINTRKFGAASMAPLFAKAGDTRSSWRDIYTPDWKHTFYIHGSVDRGEQKASLYFFPPKIGADDPTGENFTLENLDWKMAGAAFRLQRITGGGYRIENPDGTTSTLSSIGDTARVNINGVSYNLILKNEQYYTIYVIAKDLGIGVVYILAVTSLAVLGIFMAGFGSNNKWSLYGAIRSVAQLFSYEIPMTLAVLGPVLMSGTLSMVDLVEAQRSTWFVIPQFLAFFVFLVSMTSEINRSPFDLPEAESELVAGFHTEYSGLKFGFFFLAEYANMFIAAAVMTVLFFGGWKGPFIIPYIGEFLSTFMWFMIKCLFWLGVFIWFRATFPRFRIDQMMDYAWKVLLPIAFANVVFTGFFTFSDWNLRIFAENNWRIWDSYIKPLFVSPYTNIYAIPIMLIIAILFAHEFFEMYRDRVKEKMQKDAARADENL